MQAEPKNVLRPEKELFYLWNKFSVQNQTKVNKVYLHVSKYLLVWGWRPDEKGWLWYDYFSALLQNAFMIEKS